MEKLTVLFCLSMCLSVQSQDIAVKFDGNREELEQVANGLGFEVVREFKYSEIFLLQQSELSSRTKRSSDHVDILRAHPKVLSADEDEMVYREKRYIVYDKQLEMPLREISDSSVFYRIPEARLGARNNLGKNLMTFSDPLYNDQWSLYNSGQSGGRPGIDLNVQAAWTAGYTGRGVTVCILDDGIYHNHTDLVNNYEPAASTDLNDPTDMEFDPMPDMSTETKIGENRHGTWCAGEIAAGAHNDACGVGIAYECKIGGIRLLDGNVTDAMEAEALLFNNQLIDIYSSSWGPYDNGRTMDGPRKQAAAALRKGVRMGRGGKGSIFMWALGNGGLNGDCCGADGYVSSIETLSIGAVTDKGTLPYFMERCTSTLAVVASGGEEEKGEEEEEGIVKIKVVTTDLADGCIENFQGTSSAAPYAAGCAALALQANPDLTWRDVQHLVVHSARIPSVDHSWIINGAGLHVSHNVGFGMLNCGRLVALAEKWVNVPEQHTCKNQRMAVNKYIPSNGHIRDEVIVGCHGNANRINHVEHVQVHVDLEHSRRGDLEIYVVSPSNTWSRVLAARPLDDSDKGIDFTFMTVHSWGEHAEGRWALYIKDEPSKRKRVNTGQLKSWTLTIYGTATDHVNKVETKATGEAHFPNLVEVEKLMLDEERRLNEVKVTPLDQMPGNALNTPPIHPPTLKHSPKTTRLLQELISNYDKVSEYTSQAFKSPANREVLSQQKKYIDSSKHSIENIEEERSINEIADMLLSEIKSEEETKRKEEKRKEERRKMIEKKMLEEHLMDHLVRRFEDELEKESRNGNSQNKQERTEEMEESALQGTGGNEKRVREGKKEDEDIEDLLQELEKDIEERSDSEVEEDKRKEGSMQTVAKLRDGFKSSLQGRGGSEKKEEVQEKDLMVRTLSDLLKYLQEEP